MKLPIVPALVLVCAPALLGSDTQHFPGHGTAIAEKATFSQAKENQKALDRAQQAAFQDALQLALVKLMGVNQLEPAKVGPLVKDLADHSSTFIRNQEITETRMDGLNAIVNLKLKVDLAGMKEYLESKGLSLTQNFEAKFKVFVLTYTAEGMDPDRSRPQILHEEVHADHQSLDVQVQVDASEEDYAHHQGQHLHAADEEGALHASSHASGSGHSAQQSASVSVAAEKSSYLRITDYADPSKRGMSGNNDVKALLSGAFTREGLTVATLEVPFAGKEFKSEDEFINQVLGSVRRNANVQGGDCVAIAVNSLTPVSGRRHQFTSKVTFHFVRVQDGVNLIPADAIAKRSEPLASDDEARTQSTTLALMTLNARLPDNVRKGLQRLQRESVAAPAPAGIYLIEIQNLQDRSILVKVKQFLRQENFTFKSDSRAGGTVENLTLTLGNRSPEEVKDVLDGLPNVLELLSKDDAGAKLRVK